MICGGIGQTEGSFDDKRIYFPHAEVLDPLSGDISKSWDHMPFESCVDSAASSYINRQVGYQDVPSSYQKLPEGESITEKYATDSLTCSDGVTQYYEHSKYYIGSEITDSYEIPFCGPDAKLYFLKSSVQQPFTILSSDCEVVFEYGKTKTPLPPQVEDLVNWTVYSMLDIGACIQPPPEPESSPEPKPEASSSVGTGLYFSGVGALAM